MDVLLLVGCELRFYFSEAFHNLTSCLFHPTSATAQLPPPPFADVGSACRLPGTFRKRAEGQVTLERWREQYRSFRCDEAYAECVLATTVKSAHSPAEFCSLLTLSLLSLPLC